MQRLIPVVLCLFLAIGCTQKERIVEVPVEVRVEAPVELLIEVPEYVKLKEGRFYDEGEIRVFQDLRLVAKVPIANREILVYKTGEDDAFNNTKIVVLNDTNGNFLDAACVNLPDNKFGETTFISETACIFQTTKDRIPVLNFLYADSESNKFAVYPMWDRIIGDVVILDGCIYYSSEYDSIWRIECQRSTPYKYDGYYPCVELFIIDSYPGKRVGFVYNNRSYELTGDLIRFSEVNIEKIEKPRLDDFLVIDNDDDSFEVNRGNP